MDSVEAEHPVERFTPKADMYGAGALRRSGIAVQSIGGPERIMLAFEPRIHHIPMVRS
jgi:hypothetical protein